MHCNQLHFLFTALRLPGEYKEGKSDFHLNNLHGGGVGVGRGEIPPSVSRLGAHSSAHGKKEILRTSFTTLSA